MRLIDLFEKRVRKMAGNIPIIPIQRPPSYGNDGEQIGTGIQAIAYDFKKLPGAIIKEYPFLDTIEDDSTIDFTNLCIDNDGNPFFPKIYKAVIYEWVDYDDNGEDHTRPYLIIQMEKLLRINHPKIMDAAKHMMRRLKIEIQDTSKKGKYRKVGKSDLADTSYGVFDIMNDPGERQKLQKKTPNPQFGEVLNKLEPLIVKYGQDLHNGNWMVRLSPAGPQLVFIDPLFPSTEEGNYQY